MAKRSRRGLSKKGLIGLKKERNEDGKLGFSYKGGWYPTLRSVILKNRLDQLGLLK